VASAFATAAVLASLSRSGTAAAAALACAFDPDLGAVLRAVLAGALRVDLEAAEVFLVAGFFLPALERAELDFGRLLGFLGVATAANYSEARSIRRRFSAAG